MSNSPILFILFNRPDTTRIVFETIRRAKPPRLYIAADGARPGRAGEKELCEAARAIRDDVDWPCCIQTLYHDDNLGCRRALVKAITWFFEHEEQGIILEDDCVPVPSFFPFCDELLERYRDDPRVAMISGTNPIPWALKTDNSYLFSSYPHIWGWASWRRAWQEYDRDMTLWPAFRDAGGLKEQLPGHTGFEKFWRPLLDKVYRYEIDTWDYQWMVSIWTHRRLAIIPEVNLVDNIGFGNDATHTTGGAPGWLKKARPQDIPFPLRHPKECSRNFLFDRLDSRHALGISWTVFFRGLTFHALIEAVPKAWRERIKDLLRRMFRPRVPS